MRSFLKFLFCSALLVLWAGRPLLVQAAADPAAATPAGKDDKKKDDKKKGDDKKKDSGKKKKKKPDDTPQPAPPLPNADGKPAATPAPGQGPKLNLPLVPHHPSTGLKIPYYDEQGNLQMIYTIGTATRLDDDTVEMKETQVETYNNEGEPDMTVELPVSKLNLNTKVVSSQTKTTITREDFVLTGDGVEFDTISKQAKLVGHVHMIVYNLNDDEAKSPTPETPEPAPAAGTPAPPHE